MGVAADTTQFAAAMVKSGSAVEKLGSEIKMAAVGFAAFEAVKAAGSAIVGFVTSSMAAIDSTRLLGERLGTSAESIQGLQYAAKIADVDSEALASGLEKLQIKLGEVAVDGAGPAADAFRRLHLNARQLANAGPVAAFQQIAAALEKVPNAAERSALSVEMMGKGAMGLAPLIAQGSKGIADLMAEFQELGNPLKDLDFAKVDEAGDSMTKIGVVIQGVGNAIAVELAPFITFAADSFVDLAREGLKSGSFIAQGMDWAVSGLGLALDGVNVFKTAFHGIEMVVAEVVSGFLGGIEKILEGVDYLAHKLGQDSDLAGAMKGWSKAFGDVAIEELNAAESAWSKIGKGESTVRKVVNDIVIAADERAKLGAGKNPFQKPGAVGAATEDPKAHRFAGAFEMGSKEAYSAVVKARTGSGQNSAQNRTASATERTAAAVERLSSAGALGGKRRGAGMTPARPAAF